MITYACCAAGSEIERDGPGCLKMVSKRVPVLFGNFIAVWCPPKRIFNFCRCFLLPQTAAAFFNAVWVQSQSTCPPPLHFGVGSLQLAKGDGRVGKGAFRFSPVGLKPARPYFAGLESHFKGGVSRFIFV